MFADFLKKHRSEIIIFLIAFLLRMAAFGFFAIDPLNNTPFFPRIGSDSGYYLSAAESISQEGRFVYLDDFMPNSYETPVYPAFLAVLMFLFHSLLAISIIQNILSGLSAVFLYRVGLLFSGHVGWGAAILFAIDPIGIFYSNFIVTESLFLFFLLAAVYFLVTFKEEVVKGALLSGIFLGGATLTRPVGEVFFLAFIIFYFLYNRKMPKFFLKMSIVFFIGFIIITGPWFIRNKILFDSWELSAVASWQFNYAHAPLLYAHLNNIPQKKAIQLFHEQLLEISPYTDEIARGKIGTLHNTPYMWQIALGYIGQHKLSFIKFHFIKTLPFFLSDGLREIGRNSGIYIKSLPSIGDLLLKWKFFSIIQSVTSDMRVFILFISGFTFWLFIDFFLFIGFVFSYKQKREIQSLAVLFFLMIIAIAAVAGGAVAHPRYRLSVSPFMFLLAVYGFFELKRRLYLHKNTSM